MQQSIGDCLNCYRNVIDLRRTTSPRPAPQTALMAGLALSLAACAAIDPYAAAPPTAAKPWAPEELARIPGGKATLDAFSTQSDQSQASIQRGRVYDLPHLIDLAQQTNPETRAAWQAARDAAARLGIAEGAYLPTLAAIGLASYGHLPDYDEQGPFVVNTGVLEPSLRLDWLLLVRSTRRRCQRRVPDFACRQSAVQSTTAKRDICCAESVFRLRCQPRQGCGAGDGAKGGDSSGTGD